MSIPLTLMDPDDLNLILDWLIERYSTEPDPKDFFENAARDDHNNLQAFARGIDHQTSVHRYDSAKTNAFFQCFEAANLANAHQLLPKLASLLWCAERFMNIEDYVEQLTNIFEHLLRFAPPPFAALKILADCDDAEFRLVAAKHLGGQTEHERKLLRKLLRDNDNRIRAAANKALTRSGASQWWQASFTQDPSEHIHDDDTAQQAVKDWIQLCSTDYGIHSNYIPSHSPPILALMPEPVRCDALRVYLRNPDTMGESAAPLGPILIQCEGGLDALDDILDHWNKKYISYSHTGYVVSILAGADPQKLKQLWRSFLDATLSQLPNEKNYFDTLSDLKAKIAIHLWPQDEPLDPIIERIERTFIPSIHDSISSIFSAALAEHFSAERIPWNLIEDRIYCSASRWTIKSYNVPKLLSKAPPHTLERITQYWLHHGDPDSLAWVLKRTFFPDAIPHDERERNLLLCWQDARFRAALFADADLIKPALPWFLARLRAADTSFVEAAQILRYSPAILVRNVLWITREAELSETSQTTPQLPPQPPPLTEEWTNYRILRDNTDHQNQQFWQYALTILPENPSLWEPSDFSLIQKAKTLWSQSAREINVFYLASAIYASRSPSAIDDLALLSKLPNGLPERDVVTNTLLAARALLASSLGLARPPVIEDDDH
jgi:hypothetical protein